MTAVDIRFRKNFVVASVLHVALIAGIISWEMFFADSWKPALASGELITPADILGDLPKGSGHGRGAYAPPKEPAGANEIAGPNEAMSPPDETTAPAPKPVAQPKAGPNEILIPKKNSPKTAAQDTKAAAASRKPPTAVTATRSTAAKPTVTTARSAGAGTGVSADQIRNRFAKALAAAEGGTPYGDGKAAGGGEGKSSRIGSPDGSPDGMVGGVGQGSPFWQYYQHVHDQMYEAWEQPGDGLSKKLIVTVLIRVARDGTITEAELRNSSGNKLMDDSALTAARKVHRLDPPPDPLVKGPTANITVDFQVEG